MPNPAAPLHEQLRRELARLTGAGGHPSTRAAVGIGPEVDVVVTPNEVNDKHGTGPLVKRVFAGCDVFSIRSRDSFGGEQQFGSAAVLVPQAGESRAQAFQNVLQALGGRRVRRVVCVPYFPEDLLTSIALHELFAAPLCCWLMDDQNVAVSGIPDALMREFLSKCALRLTTHPEMRIAYERKFGLRFDLLPAVSPVEHVFTAGEVPRGPDASARIGALVGSIWSQDWFERLCDTVGPSGYAVRWYGNHKAPWFEFRPERLEAGRIEAVGIVPEARLAEALRGHLYAVVPTGTLENDTGNALAVAQLSLPGRILFVASASNTPVIIVGSEETPAARFVKRFDIGVTAPYTPEGFRAAVEQVSAPETQRRMRANAARVARALSSDGIGSWLWRSVERGAPVDRRFEDLLPREESDMVAWVEPPIPGDLYREYRDIYAAARRLRARGLRPDFVIDVGASQGIWSYAVSRSFPEARYLLVDPLADRYHRATIEAHLAAIPRAEYAKVAISNEVGRTSFQVPPDLYGASLLQPTDFRKYDSVEIEISTVDALARDKDLTGRGILKADVQFAEHLVLEGAKELLPRIDAIVLELSLYRFEQRARTFLEMLNELDRLGFRYWEDAGCWRSPVDGLLLQKDVLFVRKGVCEPEAGA